MAYRGETILDCNEEDEKNARRRGRATSSTFLEDDEGTAQKRPPNRQLFRQGSIGQTDFALLFAQHVKHAANRDRRFPNENPKVVPWQ